MERPETMAAFFDARAEGYNDHMRECFESEKTFARFYEAVSSPVESTHEPLKILDLGCGTGLEIEALLRRVPNAQVTGIDVSEKMLQLLRRRYAANVRQISLVADSYLTISFPDQTYDYVVSVMSIHHLLPDVKRALYRKIRAALKSGGKYAEGDTVTRSDAERQFLDDYAAEVGAVPQAAEGEYHIDVPLSIETQRKLLLEAGFRDFEVVWQKDSTALWNMAVYVVTA